MGAGRTLFPHGPSQGSEEQLRLAPFLLRRETTTTAGMMDHCDFYEQ